MTDKDLNSSFSREKIATTNFPTPLREDAFKLSDEEKERLIGQKFKEILETLGLDLNNPSLKETPERISKMYVREIFSGLNPDHFPAMKIHHHQIHTVPANEIVYVKDISFISFCEHHFVPFSGFANIAYVPNGKLIGLSKINRIVKYFAKRPQLQERLTAQIVDALSMVLETEDIACSITAQHFCVAARGVEDRHSSTTTHICKGVFENECSKRSDFFGNIKPPINPN